MNHSATVCRYAACADHSTTRRASCFASREKMPNHAASQNLFVGIHRDASTHSDIHVFQGMRVPSPASSSATRWQGMRRCRAPRPSKHAGPSSARILGLISAQISRGASREKWRRAFCASRDITATCTAEGIAPLYPLVSPAR